MPVRRKHDAPGKPQRSKKKRKKFKTKFVRFPTRWADAMRTKSSGAAYELALVILDKAFECKARGHGEIVLSAAVTKMPRNTRRRAAKELVELGLIELHRGGGNQAYKVRLGRGPKVNPSGPQK